MPRRLQQQEFIDDELLRAPMTFNAVIDAVLGQWRRRLPAHDRIDGDPCRALALHRGELVAEALNSLRASAQAELQGLEPPAPPALRPKSTVSASSELSLIGEDDVVVDIEIARCIRTIRQTADAELRELQTFTSALANDVNVTRDNNPFRPERFVAALWAGLQRLPLSRPMLTAFLHEAAAPLAEALQVSYASASRRLHEQGIVPGAYRTIVYGGAASWAADAARYRPPADLHSLHDSMPTPLDALPPQVPEGFPELLPDMLPGGPPDGSPARAPAPPGHGPAHKPVDAQLIELLARLFAAIQQDPNLASHTLALLQRLQPAALRLAQVDGTLLDTYDHPIWRFMDQLAFDLACSTPALRRRLLALCRSLVEHLATADPPQASQFSWAIVRLAAARRHALAQALTHAAPKIERLQRFSHAEAGNSTDSVPLDIGSLDTVPADLMPASKPVPAPSSTLSMTQASQPGTPLRVYLQGEWRSLMCLWQDPGHELLLLFEPAAERLWALRQPALARLLAEKLARPLRVRSLVRRAADTVLHAL